MLNFGIIGYGKMGQTRHSAILRTDVGDVSAIYGYPGDPVPEDKSVASPEDILANKDIEAVFVCTINSLNKDLTIDPDEIEDAIWVTREEMAEAFAGNHPTLLPARKGAIAHFLLQAWLSDRLD